MKLAAGTHLGPYEVVRPIGAGGMGIVYSADDPRLRRRVAIKMLPDAKGENFSRFEREARTIGGLNHPNLLTLFDVGEHDGVPFLVTELLEGKSLRERLKQGPLKLRESIRIAAEVARGLAAAHDAGIVHRDVKPDNIFLTSENRTKILDFGIAKLRRASVEMPAQDLAHQPTSPATADTGVVIGTPGYMAPEQLDGGAVDERTDIFALGVVLYEMICGRRAFFAENSVEESYAILKVTPDPPKGATKSLARVVMRCLEKRKEARFQSATDLAFALDELDASTDPIARISKSVLDPAESVATIREQAPLGARRRRRMVVGASAGVIAIVGLAMFAGFMLGRGRSSTQRTAWPSVVEGGVTYKRVTYHTQSRWNARLAMDGASVLYSVRRGEREEVVRSQIGQPTILPTGIAGALVDVSSRGELAVITDMRENIGGTLARAFEGSGLKPVADRVTSAAWMPDGEQLAVIRGAVTLEFPIGNKIVDRPNGRLNRVRVSPAGDELAFVDNPLASDTAGYVVVVDRTGKELFKSQHHVEVVGVAWSPDGSEVWFTDASTIYGLARNGTERVVLRGVNRLELVDIRAGKLLVAPSDVRFKLFTGPIGAAREVGWFDGSEAMAVSADGSVLGFIEGLGTGQTAGGYAQFVRRADQPATQIGNGWLFTLLPDASAAIAMIDQTTLERIPIGVGARTKIPLGKIAQLDPSDPIAISWSGRHVVVRGAEAGGAMRLWRIDLENPVPQPITAGHTAGPHPISPDGSLLAIARAAGGIELVPVGDAGAPKPIEGQPDERPIGFTSDGAYVFTMRIARDTIAVDRIELATSKRSSWTHITPEQPPVFATVVVNATGDVITYSTNSDSSDLYVIEPEK